MAERIYYTVSLSDYLAAPDTEKLNLAAIPLNIVIDELAALKSLLSYSCFKTQPFVITVTKKVLTEIGQQQASLLYTITTLSAYCTIRGEKIILVPEGIQRGKPVEELSQVSNFFTRQGEFLKICFVPQVFNLNSTTNEVVVLNKNDAANIQLNQQLQDYLLAAVTVPLIIINNLMETNLPVKLTNQAFIKTEIVLQLKTANETYAYETALLKDRMRLYLEFIPLSKKISEKEYYDLLDWYHKEYEVLPLWYKRAGHLIKIATGKRSLRL